MPSRSCGGAASKPANHVRADPATHLLIRLFGSLEMPPQVGPRSQSHSTTGYASEPFAVRGTFKRPSQRAVSGNSGSLPLHPLAVAAQRPVVHPRPPILRQDLLTVRTVLKDVMNVRVGRLNRVVQTEALLPPVFQKS